MTEFPLTFETPFSWDSYPQGVITHMRISDDDPEDKPPTALIESQVTEHPDLGNALRIAVHVPRDPKGHVGRGLNALNRLDTEAAGASHSFGGWTVSETAAGEEAPGCVVFLPAAFAESVANRPYVMREILLTLVRQALLARRVLIPADERSAEDDRAGIGLAVAPDPLATFVAARTGWHGARPARGAIRLPGCLTRSTTSASGRTPTGRNPDRRVHLVALPAGTGHQRDAARRGRRGAGCLDPDRNRGAARGAGDARTCGRSRS